MATSGPRELHHARPAPPPPASSALPANPRRRQEERATQGTDAPVALVTGSPVVQALTPLRDLQRACRVRSIQAYIALPNRNTIGEMCAGLATSAKAGPATDKPAAPASTSVGIEQHRLQRAYRARPMQAGIAQ